MAPKRATAAERKLTEAMATVSDQAQATNEKLDTLSSQLSGIAAWMKTMDASVADLATTTSNLKLHAEDASARLNSMESHPSNHHRLRCPLRQRSRAWRRDGPMGTATTTLHGGKSMRSPDLSDFPRLRVRSFL